MSLRELVEADNRTNPSVCAIARIGAEQPELGNELADLLKESLNGIITLSSIRRALASSGLVVGKDSLQRHRAGECRCGR